ncbi:hypothetical protein KL918_000442 [Ogataea parapolymorpha]|uniref:Genetic interactor of prohibitin 5, mitochondrial n=1 Tax=Ogataea parapolymorpha (strain ATCC 26012 / BCRC 20466 / JCM 22074 / NRRL Y-7560 / DL-1) TaxID=871575 RepID=W1Q7V7_OGAPD|nr:hypothetical protein HPODL_03110 [Ogataea parapolymorpha DL-1]ESW96488.1 hypothetical protein HPODL_03110 [Ogataea parapolymorpha DL-1]KAG7870238.1 hypothetical protein KL918_000442 [Ogataea parapolymorpha]KAG7875187.1 hypothetical protein KL916_000799 [Ogataea parapolymorpha]
MQPNQKQAILEFYRSLNRKLSKLQLDAVADKRLKFWLRSQFKNTATPLHRKLQEGKRFDLTLDSSLNGHYKSGIKLLRMAYYDLISFDARAPKWLSDFARAKVYSRAQKDQFINEYAGILKITHDIHDFKSIPGLVDKYMANLRQSETKSLPTNHSITDILNGVKPAVQSSGHGPKKPLSSLFSQLRTQYKDHIDHDWSLPQLNVKLSPNSAGLPLSPSVRRNKIFAKLLQIKRFINEYPPMKMEDMEHLNKFVKSETFDNHPMSFAYKRFTRDSFALTENVKFRLSKIRDVSIPPPKELLSYYVNVK